MKIKDILNLANLEKFLKEEGYADMAIDNIIKNIELYLEEGYSFNGLLNDLKNLKSKGKYVYPNLKKFKKN